MAWWMALSALMLQQPPSPPMRVEAGGGAERPIYRAVRPGEQRDEGRLRRINCPARGPVSFVVKQKTAVVQYTAPAIASVDFIVYRKDFRGPVTCEGFGAGEPVYVTWKAEGKARRVIAIEFVPK